MSQAVAAVEAVLSLPEEELDYARAKIAFDRIIDPSIDEGWVLAELERLTEKARQLAGSSTGDAAKLNALRKLIYKSGPWNGNRPFRYDHKGFKALRGKLLSHYLRTRRGNCVSMPILFLILADRLGLKVALSLAPQHVLVRYHPNSGNPLNLETTSGADPAREAWYRQIMPMTDRSIQSGFYLRSLPKREGAALMATTILEHYAEQQRFQEMLPLSALLLRHNPRDGLTWVKQGHASYSMVWHEYLKPYPSPFLIPPHLRPRFDELSRIDLNAYRNARALGWEPPAEMAVLYERFEEVGL